MDRILIIADDFTGAGDTGVAFAKYGWDVRIVMDAEEVDRTSSFVIDTEARNVSSREAERMLKDLFGKFELSRFDGYFKKVDSILRGNICAELQVVKEAVKPDIMVFNPANPRVGRTVKKGIVQVDGVNLCDTKLSKDPLSPVKNEHIKSFLEQGLGESVAYFTQEELKGEKMNLSDCKNIVFDAQTETELETAVSLLSKTGKRILWAGSAGLADAVARVYSKKEPVLALIGSVTSVSQKQVEQMEGAGIKVAELDVPRLLKGGTIDVVAEEAVQYLRAGQDVTIVSVKRKEDYGKAVAAGKQSGYDENGLARFTQEQFGNLAVKILEQVKPKGVILSGGDIAAGVMKKIHVSTVAVLKEVLPSIPLCMVESGAYPGLLCITKSGSFGEEDTLVKAVNYIKYL